MNALRASAVAGLLAAAACVATAQQPAAPPVGGPRFRAATTQPAARKVTYLGVATSPADETVGRQLNLPEGVGLVVNYVEPKGPAKDALRKHDVLHKLGDQILINPPQLAVLIRMHKAGETASLTVIRGGKSQAVDVTLGEESVPPRRDAWRMWPGGPGEPGRERGVDLPRWLDQFPEELRERLGDQIRQHMEHQGREFDIRQFMEEMERRFRPGPMQGDRPAQPRLGQSIDMSLADGEHNITLQFREGKGHLTIKDKAGKVIHDGDVMVGKDGRIDPDSLGDLPPELREKLTGMILRMSPPGRVPRPDMQREQLDRPRDPHAGEGGADI